jgi:hypothetical protein
LVADCDFAQSVMLIKLGHFDLAPQPCTAYTPSRHPVQAAANLTVSPPEHFKKQRTFSG